MDLAKIRKKALIGLNSAPIATDSQKSSIVALKQNPLFDEVLLHYGTPGQETVILSEGTLKTGESLQYVIQPLPFRRDNSRTPLETILEGRANAGCDKGLQVDPHDQIDSADVKFEEFLCIRISDETYGINIMQIKEIIKTRLVTEVPRAPSVVHGVISLRGVIIPVLDMTDRLGLSRSATTGKERVVVVKSGAEDCFTGLLVDQVTHVARVSANRIESAPATLNGIDRNFIKGIGRTDNLVIILLNIESIVDIHVS